MRTRIAPTPSGFLHLGNIFSFALTADLARRSGAVILLRIDDLDRDRSRRTYIQDIFDTLRYMDIPWDEGPGDVAEFGTAYSQALRLDAYRQALGRLREKGLLFACTCSRAELPAGGYPGTCRDKGIPLDTAGVTWRIRTDGAELPASMRDFVVRKRDGFPAYQVASVVDDLMFAVDLVVRGEDLLPSTAAQRYLASCLGEEAFDRVTFVHHRLLTDPSGGKLSKSAGATSVRYLRRSGLTSREIYGRIGEMLGVQALPGTWAELAEVSRS